MASVSLNATPIDAEVLHCVSTLVCIQKEIGYKLWKYVISESVLSSFIVMHCFLS